jgi:hypothetical protein
MLCKVDKVTFHDFSSSLRDFWVNNVNKGQIIMAMTVDHEKKEKRKRNHYHLRKQA